MKNQSTFKRGGAFALAVISALALLTAVLCLPAQAGTVTPYSGTTFNGGNATTNVANAATNTPLTCWNFATSSQNSLEWSFQCTAANSTGVILRFDTSNNGNQWITNALSVSQTPNGNSLVVGGTNLTGVVPLWRLRTIENSGGGDITNLTITAYQKNGI